jgi:5-methylcytosine-specific restriction protein A
MGVSSVHVDAPGPRDPRRSAHARGYTKRWARASKHFLLLYPLCGMRPNHQLPVLSQCFLEKRDTPSTQTDHVIPHRGDERLFWSIDNWQALCATCGARKSQAGL